MINTEIIKKCIDPNFDDGETIFLDFSKVSIEELCNTGLGKFDLFNIPFETPKALEEQYYVSFFDCYKSSTGVCAMVISKNRQICKNSIKRSELLTLL